MSEQYFLTITKIVDADTIYGIKSRTFGSLRTTECIIRQKVKVRILGIDAPEIRGKRKSQKGVEAANYVRELLPKGKSFAYLYSGKKDSFGRELGDVMLPGERPLSLHLISMGYAKEMR